MIGSGIAGLVAALTAADRSRVAVVSKGGLDDGSTRWAQGGIAAAIGSDDNPQLHFDDTIAAGRGLCNPEAVRILVDDAAGRIDDLVGWGVAFDDTDGRLDLAQEAGHSRARIVHARDTTGAEIQRALGQRVRTSDIALFEGHALDELHRSDRDGRCIGADLVDVTTGARHRVSARAVVIATGGAGQLWGQTTNPAAATGEALVMAYDRGAELESLEFMQFHPTALAVEGAPRFLISEAMRGEGALIINGEGERFTVEADPRGELAPRDVVSSAIWNEMRRSGAKSVFLDCRPLGAAVLRRFPAIAEECAGYGLDITTDCIPIAPAAHYLIGGVRTDVTGATSVPGLFACGEAASTGVHGANRLASNSLLEGVVFGRRAGEAAVRDLSAAPPVRASANTTMVPTSSATTAATTHLGEAMWTGAGMIRSAATLTKARAVADDIAAAAGSRHDVAGRRLHRSARLAALICTSALRREESRGAHCRSDFPTTNNACHESIVMTR